MGHQLVRLLRLLPAALLLTLSAQAAGTIEVLYTFSGGADGGAPEGALIEDAKGNLYGTASVGGDLKCAPPIGCGTVFKLTPANKLIVLHTFAGGTDGASPYAALLMDAGGNLYGTTSAGGEAKGCFGNGCGTVFKIDPTGKETVLYRFQGKTDGGLPYSTLIMDTAGNLYGTTQEGGDLSCGLGSTGCGTVFKLTKAGKETVLYSFKGLKDGAYPGNESLLMDSKGNFYGTASHGGDNSCNPPNGCGTVFMLAKTGKLTVLHTFTGGADGSFPESGVTLVNDVLYGTAVAGGKYNLGTLYTINLAADLSTNLHSPETQFKFYTIYNFKGGSADGGRPYAAPTFDALDLILYLGVAIGGIGDGGFCSFSENGTEITFVELDASENGADPVGSLLVDPTRNGVVGTASQAGSQRNGSPDGAAVLLRNK